MEEQLDRGPCEPIVIKRGLSLSEAQAFTDKNEDRKGFFFVAHDVQGGQHFGDLLLYYDSTGVHEIAANTVVSSLLAWFWPWWSGARLNAIIEVAFSQNREALENKLRVWAGAALVAIGVDVEYPAPAGAAPQMSVLMQLPGRQQPSAVVDCGAGSGCVAPAMLGYTIFVPVDKLLAGAPWLTRLLISTQLAVQVPLYSIVYGGACAAWDVLVGRRSLLDVAGAGVRSLRGPWWGVVPLDAFVIRSAVFKILNVPWLVRSA
ncbi:hypothetical protein GPECTOR_1554g716 [Gonium pectorale]|uniref:Uncharacterized protein n=1 Tax=Gonium pectorale TaxID=33097 RepID=A0A150FTE3_GONPE|nr:hypothetical protein GPECTOR_1554g716 [Gonium pectorale]|eukprot:KXZ40882.1 hypothetical protein GPECTOR_1554g716 [Gonium pectorale]